MLDQLEPVRKLGQGGEGTVWLAWDRALSRWLAVKIVRLAPGSRAVGEQMLASLAPFARELLDSAVAPLIASGIVDAPNPRYATEGLALYVVMPYLHGLPAHELARGPLSAREVAAIFAEAARLLTRLHAQGLAHLDLKPGNLIVDVQGRLWLVDMHLSTWQGTSGFAATEQQQTLAPAGGEGRARGKSADARSDWYALGRTLAALWTGIHPRNPGDPLPELPRPAVTLSGPERLAHERLAEIVDQLTGEDPASRPVPGVEEADALARDLGAPDRKQALAGAVAQSPFHARLAEIERAQAERGGDSVRSELRRGPNPGQARPSTSLGANGSALRGKLAWAAAALVPVLATAGFASYRHLHPAHVNPLPSIPAPDQSERPWNAGCKILPPAKPLAVLEEAPPGDAVFQETIHQPVDRFSLNLLYGPDVLVMESPKPGDTCKVRLPPATYQRNVLYPNGKSYKDTLELEAGSPNHDITYAYGNQAPLSGRETGSILVTAAQGPTLLSLGPAWIDDATWDADAGTLSIASYWGDCKDPTRELPWSPQGRGAADAKFHLDRTERLCAYPKPDAKDGFRVRLAQSEDLGQPDPSPQSGRFADATPAEPPIDPAKRFNAPYEIPELVAPTLIMPGPAVVTKGDWNLEAGSLKIGGDRNCTSTLSDFAYRTVHTIDERPLDIPPDKSLCAVPNEDQPGGHFVANLEGYFK